MQTQQVRGTATTVYHDGHDQCVIYHQTVVVRFDAIRIILDTGGFKTVTTKCRMMQASNQFGLEDQVYQRDHAWFVDFDDQTIPFDADQLTLQRPQT